MRFKDLQVLLCLLLLSILTKWIVKGCDDGDIRLADGATETEGRVQVCVDEVWGSVCDNHWDARDARVACRQLGYESDTALAVGYPSAEITINRDYIECSGEEGSLFECPICSFCRNFNQCFREAGVICYPNGTECNNMDIRLVSDSSAYQGRVEICFRGLWGTVCGRHWNWEVSDYDDIFLSSTVATVICRQLGLPLDGATLIPLLSNDLTYEKPIFLDNTTCNGTEERLSDCSHRALNEHDECWHDTDIGVICQDDCVEGEVRIVGGLLSHEGRVEVCLNHMYGTICDDRWDNNDAAVICYQLGFSREDARSVMANAFGYGVGSGSIWLDEVACTGQEENITQCTHNAVGTHNCVHSEDAGVLCKSNGDPQFCTTGEIVLRGGRDRSEGRVDVCINDRWGTVCAFHVTWGEQEMDVVCQQLGFSTLQGSPPNIRASFFGTGMGPIVYSDLECIGNETAIQDCPSNYGIADTCFNHYSDVAVVCNDSNGTQCINGSIRLVDGNSQYEGRVEICLYNHWGTVCDDSWDNVDATIVCRQLNLTDGRGVPLRNSYFGTGIGIIWMDDVDCMGNETNLLGCTHTDGSNHNCGHNKDAGVICPLPVDAPRDCENGEIQLVDGGSINEGRVEICLYNHWGTVCDDSWDNVDATIVCRQLNLTDGRGVPLGSSYFGAGIGIIWMDDVDCMGTETNLLDCTHTDGSNHNCGHNEDAGVICPLPVDAPRDCENGEIQLVDGGSINEGRVEICMHNHWGTVCDDSWNNVDATIVCRQLNLTDGRGVPLRNSYFGAGIGIIWMDDVDCMGTEINLLGCTHTDSSNHNCVHNEDASVFCPLPVDARRDCENGEIQLVDGGSINEGRVEICYNNHWGAICDNDWRYPEAEVVCRQLGFDGEEYLAEYFDQGDGLIFLGSVYCTGDEYDLLECTGEGVIGEYSCSQSQQVVGVNCSYDYIPSTSTSFPSTFEPTHYTTESVTNSTSSASPTASFRTGGIVLGVVLSFLIICAAVGVVLVFLCFVRRWHVKRVRLAELLMLDEFLMRQTDIESKNQYATTRFQTANGQVLQSSLLNSLCTVDDLPDDILIPTADIRLMDTLGQGEYGIVYKAHLIKPMIAPRQSKNSIKENTKSNSRRVSRNSTVYFQNPTEPLTVAVKTLKGFFTEENVEEIIRESKKMQEFDHPNVLSMLGICLDAGPAPYIVMPFMSNGSLISYLKENRQELVLHDTTDEDTISITQKRMTDMCLQIAKGMEYLASKKLIHRDLAARNCMMDSEWIIKVADFGLSESTTTKDYFRQAEASNIKLPIKWMAPESLSDGVFSEKTDVWSFGVTCWEVFSGGMSPYRGVHPLDVINMLDTGKRLERPNNIACSDTMYSMMNSCWHFESKDRPDFSRLVVGITKSLETLSDYLDVSTFQFSFDKEESSRVEDTETIISTKVLSVLEEEAVIVENTGIVEED